MKPAHLTVVAEQVARELVHDKLARVSVISLMSRPRAPFLGSLNLLTH